MRVGLVRNVALGMVALVGLGLAGCDDNPTDFDADETVKITTNPSLLTLPAGATALVSSRTENAGSEPTWEEISASVDGSCGSGAITVDVAASYEPTLQPPGQFDVTAGNTLGGSCIQLSGGGASATVEVNVVGDSLAITDVPATETVDLFASVDLSGAMFSRTGDPVSPFDPASDLAWSVDDNAVMTVDAATGVVSAIGVGSATITATWTEAGATLTATQALSTNAPALAIVPPDPDSLLIDTTIDLTATLTDPTDPPATFGPFDPETDVEWVTFDEDDEPTDENDVIAVDPVTGEVTALGPGTATVRARWIPSIMVDEDDAVINNPVEASTMIDVTIPAPTLATAAPTSGNLGDLITLTGAGFHEAMSIVVDGSALEGAYEPTIVNATTATFYMPFGSVDDDEAELNVAVGAPGQLSNQLTLTRTFTDETGEPDNDSRATAPPVTFPLDLWGTVDAEDLNDRFSFSVAVETKFDVRLDWAGASGDLDLLWVDSPPTAFQACTGETATGAHPETAEGEDCVFPPGDYTVEVNSYDHETAVYHLEITVVP